MAALAGLLSLGLNLTIVGWQPFEFLRSYFPGFSQLRSPFRFAVITQMCLVLLASGGLAYLSRFIHSTSRQIVLVGIIGLIGVVENLCIPQPLAMVPSTSRTEWTMWLQGHPNHTVIAHLPFPQGLHVSDYEVEAWRMFAQISHEKPLVNGYSGNFPHGYSLFQADMVKNFPEQNLLCFLYHRLDVDTLVVDHLWLTTNKDQLGAFPNLLNPVYADDHVHIYELKDEKTTCQQDS
jgi:hypothetical protein